MANLTMQQLRLFCNDFETTRIFQYQNIKASFVNLIDGATELVLEINSNKFLIHFTAAMNRIEQLEIIAVKGFIEISLKMLKTIKRIVSKLYFEF